VASIETFIILSTLLYWSQPKLYAT